MSDADFCGSRRSRRTRSGEFWNPTGLFTNGEQGAWYDPSDLSTMFQDSQGSTPITAVEQPVSFMLDKRLGGLNALGSELTTNGDFSNGTTGWTLTGNGTLTVTNGVASIQRISGLIQVSQGISVTAGKWYRIAIAVPGMGSGSIGIRTTNDVSTSSYLAGISLASNASLYYLAASTTTVYVAVQVFGDGATIQVDNITVKEVSGNHAYTPSSASTSRPVLSARVNLVTRSEEFNDAAWTKFSATVTANAAVAPDGTTTADKIVVDNAAIQGNALQAPAYIAGASHTVSCYCKAAEWSWVALEIRGGDNVSRQVWFNLSAGTVGTANNSAVGSIASVGNGWYRCILTATPGSGATATRFRVYPTNADNTFSTGDGSSGIYAWGADARTTNDGVGLPVYQRVTTSTDYDTTGFPRYLRADGSDDYMLTPSIDFSGGDKMTVVAGVRKLVDVTSSTLVELSASVSLNNGSFFVGAPVFVAPLDNYWFTLRGTTGTAFAARTFTAPITNVISVSFDIAGATRSTEILPRVNGSIPSLTGADSADAGTGNFGNYPLYLFRRGGTVVPFGGRFYGLVVRGAATDTATLQQTESFLNSRTRAY